MFWMNWHNWNFDPLLLIGLVLVAWLYINGVMRLWARAGTGRGIRAWQAACFGGGLATLAAALISPLDRLSEALFSAHMVQHLVLILVGAPLLALGAPLIALLWAVPLPVRRALGALGHTPVLRRGWRMLNVPAVVWVLHTATIWLWHAPALYQAALVSAPVHALEHTCFLGAALLFWWGVLHPHGGRGRYGLSILLLFTTALQGNVLGALLTFSPVPWYSVYTQSERWGLTTLEDQQLAGLIMWIPASVVYLAAVAVLFALWLYAAEQRDTHVSEGLQPERVAPVGEGGLPS